MFAFTISAITTPLLCCASPRTVLLCTYASKTKLSLHGEDATKIQLTCPGFALPLLAERNEDPDDVVDGCEGLELVVLLRWGCEEDASGDHMAVYGFAVYFVRSVLEMLQGCTYKLLLSGGNSKCHLKSLVDGYEKGLASVAFEYVLFLHLLDPLAEQSRWNK